MPDGPARQGLDPEKVCLLLACELLRGAVGSPQGDVVGCTYANRDPGRDEEEVGGDARDAQVDE